MEKHMRRVLPFILLLLLSSKSLAQEEHDTEVPPSVSGSAASKGNVQNFTEYNSRDWPGEYNLGAKDFLRDTGIAYGAQWAGRWFYVRNKNSRIFDTSFSKWWDNITEWPEWDDGDSYFTNIVVHPIIGSQNYLFYRAMGHSFWMAALGSLTQSTLFEYTVEGLVETPSLQDLVFTPLLGVPLGVGLEKSSELLVRTDFVPAKILGYILNPMRNFINDRQIGVYNPFSGQFMSVSGPLTFNANKGEAIKLAYPMFLEEPLPVGRFEAAIEIVNLERQLGGEFIFYSLKAEVPSKSDLWSVYVQISQSGVNAVSVDGENVSDGFEFANVLVGGKHIVTKTNNAAVSAGMDLIVPTAYKDNIERLDTVLMYKRNFPINLQKAWTLTPYLTGAVWNDILSFQAMTAADFVLDASGLEGNDFEFRINYGATLGANIPIMTAPVLFAEFDGYTLLTADSFDKSDLFASGGLRFGRKFSPGFSMQFPLHGPDKEIAKMSFQIDFQVRF